MAQLVLTGLISGQTTTLCTFTIAVNGGARVGPDTVVLDQSIFTVPDTDAGIDIEAAALDQTKYGTLTAHVDIDADGTVHASFPPVNGSWPAPTVSPSAAGQVINMTVHFSPLPTPPNGRGSPWPRPATTIPAVRPPRHPAT